jgi:hypothetical protein
MASSLDRLRELTSRLEEKIASNTIQKSDILIDKQTSTTPLKESLKPLPKPIEPKIVVIEPKPTPTIEEVKRPKELPISAINSTREDNIARIETLYMELNIFEKSPDFDNIFIYKAMNLSGIGLKEEDFAEVREGKYIQVIAITYEPDKNGKKKAKNISLGYFGKGETIDLDLKHKIIEFVLRWRYEKAFQNLQHYKELIAKLDIPKL